MSAEPGAEVVGDEVGEEGVGDGAGAKCDAPLVHDALTLPDGRVVAISKCPNGHGKIKSPLCCGQDMTCAAA